MEDTNVTLTAAEWRAIADLIRASEIWRQAEIKDWTVLAEMKNAAGSLRFGYAPGKRDYLIELDAAVKRILLRIDGGVSDERSTD